MKRTRFDAPQERGGGGDRQAYSEERRRDAGDAYARRPVASSRVASSNPRAGNQRGGGERGDEERAIDEDLLVCPTFESWKRDSSNNSSSQEDAVAQYCDVVKRWASDRVPKFVERHWFEDWFLERYDPERAVQRHKERAAGVLKRSGEINPQHAVSLTADTNSVVSGIELQVNDGQSAYLPNIPSSAPRHVLEKALVERHGAVHLFIGETNRSAKRKDLARKGIVTFSDQQSTKDLVQLGHFSVFVTQDEDGVFVESTSEKDLKRVEVKVPVLQSRPPLNRLLPLSESERQAKDEAQALSCAKALDAMFQVEVGVDAFLAGKPATVSVLDAVVQYLRCVHLYCYFSGAQFRDMGEMLQRSTTPFLRASGRVGGGGANNSEDGKFFEQVDACAERITSSAAGVELVQEQERLELAVARKQALSAESVEEYMRTNCVEVKKDGNKTHYKCATHEKVFETEQFLRKHLMNFHAADVRVASRKLLVPLFQDLFAADEDKPLPRLPRFVEEALRDEFVPPSQHPRGGNVGGGGGGSDHSAPPQAAKSEARPYRDPDAVVAPAAAATGKVKLQYRTRVSHNL